MSNPSGPRQHWTDKDLIEFATYCWESLGDPLTEYRFVRFYGNSPSTSTIRRRFGSWRAFCDKAGVRCGEPFGREVMPQ